MDHEREFILSLFRDRHLKAGEFYPLSTFLEEVGFDDDPARSEAKRAAYSALIREGAIVEHAAALLLTEADYSLISAPQNDIAEAILQVGNRLGAAKEAEVFQLRELTEAVTAVGTHLSSILDVLRSMADDRRSS